MCSYAPSSSTSSSEAPSSAAFIAETIQQIKNDIQLSKNADELSQEFDSAIEGLGEVDYFSVNENKSKAVKKAQSKAASGLNITGYVGQYGTNSDLSKVKILIFKWFKFFKPVNINILN